jgi:hypothetical protein
VKNVAADRKAVELHAPPRVGAALAVTDMSVPPG